MAYRRGARPDPRIDEVAAVAIGMVFDGYMTIESLGWSATDERGAWYSARVFGVDGAIAALVLPDRGAIVTIGTNPPSVFFVCGCGAFMLSFASSTRTPALRPMSGEIARLPEDAQGPAAVCSSCAHGRETTPSPVPTASHAST